jgi:hypothetical protein
MLFFFKKCITHIFQNDYKRQLQRHEDTSTSFLYQGRQQHNQQHTHTHTHTHTPTTKATRERNSRNLWIRFRSARQAAIRSHPRVEWRQQTRLDQSEVERDEQIGVGGPLRGRMGLNQSPSQGGLVLKPPSQC